MSTKRESQSNEILRAVSLLYSQYVAQAEAIVRGPFDIEFSDYAGQSFYGWQTLTLEGMVDYVDGQRVDQVEARSVYANLLDSDQSYAVLRAVSWNGRAIREKLLQEPMQFEMILPARFVLISTDLVHNWLQQFADIQVMVDPQPRVDNLLPVRRLRIARDYKSAIFEKVWQRDHEDSNDLNHIWTTVWQDMSTALDTSLLITDVDEEFRYDQSPKSYAFEAYRTDELPL